MFGHLSGFSWRDALFTGPNMTNVGGGVSGKSFMEVARLTALCPQAARRPEKALQADRRHPQQP